MKTRWIDTGRVNHLRSQCTYHGLGYAHKETSLNTIVLAIPENPYMCIGHFQDPSKELNINYCKNNNLPVIRRETGGGAVYIDDKQLFIQWIFKPDSFPQKIEKKFQLFIEPIVETYRFFGIDAYAYGGHDVHVNGKKIVGTGAARIGNAEVITGNFITEFDSSHMVGALNLPGLVMQSEVSRGMKVYMSSMAEELNEVPNFEIIKTVYKKKCQELHGMEFLDDDFTKEELFHIDKQDEKLSSDSWTFSIKQPKSDCRLIKIHRGVYVGHYHFNAKGKEVEITMRLNENIIEFIHIDMESNDWKIKIEETLLGIDLTSENLMEKLKSIFTNNKLTKSEISEEEWFESLMVIKNEKRKISGGT